MRWLRVLTIGVVAGLFGVMVPAAWGAVTPGWECIPTTAGSAVVSGGTSSSPSCGAGTTAVLAPTYVSSGVGGKPTVQFSSVNVQILNGAGGTASKNGKGNLVLGYDENPGAQTGSHNLVLGQNQSYTSYGGIVGGYGNTVSASNGLAFGYANTASGPYSVVAGDGNQATASTSSVLGGYKNRATTAFSSILGGCANLIGSGSVTLPLPAACTDTANHDQQFAAISGGAGGKSTGIDASISGGELNVAGDQFSSITGGCTNVVGTGDQHPASCSSAGAEAILGGLGNKASGRLAAVSGGASNTASGVASAVSGGELNIAGGAASWIGAGCANLTGSGTSNSSSGCDPGGEAVVGGRSNTAYGTDSSLSGGEFNIAADQYSWIGAGCDNLTGSGTANTDSCDPGGEALLGGANVTLTGQDTHSP